MSARALVLLLLAITSLALQGCAGEKTRYARPSGDATVVDPASHVNIKVGVKDKPVLVDGVLSLPLIISNQGDRNVRVVFDRCEVEDTLGTRTKRHRGNYGELMCFVPPYDAREAT